MRTWPVLLLVACGGSSSPERESAPTAPAPSDEPAPYLVPGVTDATPEVDLDAVEAAFQDALDQLLAIEASPVQRAYEQVMVGQDDRCPYYYTTADGTYWYDSCVTEGGSAFNGYVFAYGEQGAVDPYYGFPMDYWSAFGAATVIDPQGRRMELGGSAYSAVTWGEGYTTFVSLVQGTFQWDGAVDGWLASDLAPDLVLYGYAVDGVMDRLMYVDGGLSGLPGGWAIAFGDNQIAGEMLGVSCGTELSGTVGLRTPDGVWVDVVFDANAGGGGGPMGETCDGCGVAYVQGAEVGEVCVDATVLVDWTVSPW